MSGVLIGLVLGLIKGLNIKAHTSMCSSVILHKLTQTSFVHCKDACI